VVDAPASVRAMMAADRASTALGIELVEADGAGAVARMSVRADMVNGHDIAHGGMLFALADTAFACACNSAGPTAVAASAEITFIQPARLGDELVAAAVLRTRFGRRAIYDVSVRRGDELVAEFRGHSHELQ
jgi:acyl-CoA thioesterase